MRVGQVTNGFADAQIFAIKINVAKELQRSRGQIAAGRIEDRVMIGKRHVLEPAVDDVLVERGPAAIAALKAELPGQRATKQILIALGVVRLHQAKRHQHHRRVIRVRVINVIVFKGPAARLWMRIVDHPIPADPHLLARQPLGRFLQRLMLGRNTALSQSDNVNRGVPDRSEARLNTEIVRIIHKQAFKILFRLSQYWMTLGVSERV